MLIAPPSHLWEGGWGRGLKTPQIGQVSPLPVGARGLIASGRSLVFFSRALLFTRQNPAPARGSVRLRLSPCNR